MRLAAKIGAVACLIAFAAVGAASATPVTYTLDLSDLTTGTLAPTSNSFTYDASAPVGSQFTNFTVDWDGITFDLTSSANSPLVVGTDCGTSANGSAAVFAMLTEPNVCGAGTSYLWQGLRLADFAVFTIQAADVSSLVGVPVRVNGLPLTSSAENDQGTFPAAEPLVATVLEPPSFVLLGSGLLGVVGMAFVRHRRHGKLRPA